METLKRLLRRLRNKLFGIPKLKTGTGVFTVPTKGIYRVTGTVITPSDTTHIDELREIYDVPTRRADEPVGGKNFDGINLTPFIKQTEDKYKFWRLSDKRLCSACLRQTLNNLAPTHCLHVCMYCGCYSVGRVECGGIFACGNLLCRSSGAHWFRHTLKSYRTAPSGDGPSGHHIVNEDEWKQTAMKYLEEHPGGGYVAVWRV